jgi:murein DD-endopeptidase MepM/ murein hydrolase activator NlpD
VLTACAALAATALLFGGSTASSITSAYAVDADLPTWQDVQDAKANQSATDSKITEIEALLVQVAKEVEATKKESEAAIAAYAKAEEELLQATARLDELNAKLAESTEEADSAATEAASLVALMYRSGGIDRSMELFLESDESTSEALLERLASMSKATERNTKIADIATRAMNDAQSLSDQADVVTEERERLRQEAEERKETAATLAAAAVEKQAQQEEQKATLEAQLEALKDTTAKTVEGYEERVRQEEEERRKAAEAAQGGGGGGGGPSGNASGWGRPIYSYYVSEEFGGSRNHGGIDLAASMWTPIYAAAAGTVTACYEFSNYGMTVDITHPDGSITRYAHQPYGGLTVNCGQWVNQGQQIGHVGTTGWSTGPHLHFETWPNASYRVNPRGFMSARGVYF